LESNPNDAYTAVLDGDGSIVVYAGACHEGAAGSSLWRFTPAETGQGTWAKEEFDVQDIGPNTLSGANYLAAGISFSANATDGGSGLYIFGGMCPCDNEMGQTAGSGSDYSDDLLSIQSSNLSVASSSSDWPIPEAGFSVTPLPPVWTNASDGSMVQEQDFLLLGGHTETAVINMSRVAVLSLPHSSWTFKSINVAQENNDLLVRTMTGVEPRSGHTATLTTDNSKLVIIGGWVGDVTNAAQPQLIILNVGLGYGGVGDWSWTAPSTTSSPFTSSGVYGHGATLLDGDVVMITGGYSLSNLPSAHRKRASQSISTQTYFYNVTSSM